MEYYFNTLVYMIQLHGIYQGAMVLHIIPQSWPCDALRLLYTICPTHLWPEYSLFVIRRGIPGKKCGKIIVKAEELSNCRVRANIDHLNSGLILYPKLAYAQACLSMATITQQRCLKKKNCWFSNEVLCVEQYVFSLATC